MEKLMSSDERIRRAEDLYYKRKNINDYYNSEEYKINFKAIKKFFKICIFCIVVYTVISIFQNRNYIFTEQFLADVDRVLNVELKEKITNISNYLNSEDIKNTESNDNSIVESQNPQYIEATLSIAEDISCIDQMKLDSEEIKSSINIQKPMEGTITSKFGVRSLTGINVSGYHTGLDIAGDAGESILSAIDGIVDSVSEYGAYGKHVVIKNGNITTMYAHCSRILVNVGDSISAGDIIAEVGSTGNSTGPHLHFEVMLDDRYIDPQYLLDY